MIDPAPTVLLTRPKAQSQRIAQALPGVDVMISPVLELKHLGLAVDPQSYSGLIFTSENGIRAAAAAADLGGLQGYAVGQRTAEVGSEFGVTLRAAGGTAESLIAKILADRPGGRWLHLRGVHSRGDLADRLKNAGLDTESAVVYDQVESPLSQSARDLLANDGTVILPVFSPRTAALLGPNCRHARAKLVLIGMSRAVIDSWTGPDPYECIAVADPSAAAMIEEIQRHIRRVA